jgi:hypothetical protein
LFDQFAVSAEDENLKQLGDWLGTELSGDASIEISHCENVAASVARYFQFVVTLLKPATFCVEPTPNQRTQDRAYRFAVFLFERQHRDHSINWIAEAKIWRSISNGAGFVGPGLSCQNNRSDVPIGGGKGVSIDTGEVNLVFSIGLRLSEGRHRVREKDCDDKNLRSTHVCD